jgi:glucokinase
VEISPTSVRAAVVDASGDILAEARRPSRASAEAQVTLEIALEAARTAVETLNSSVQRIQAVGVAAPGRLRAAEGICVSCGDFPSWREVQLAAPFGDAFHLPVSLIGTTQAAALAETRFAAAHGLSNVVLVRVGIEIDLAVIVDGRPLSLGDAPPGHAGHMVIQPGGPRCECGESGCWQALAGREALVARVVRDISSGVSSAIPAAVDNRLGAITPALICRMASAGDAVARSALEETGRFLALGLGNLIALFDPEAIIVDAVPSLVGAALSHAAEAALKTSRRAQVFSRCVLLSPSLGDSAPVLGAAAWAGLRAG